MGYAQKVVGGEEKRGGHINAKGWFHDVWPNHSLQPTAATQRRLNSSVMHCSSDSGWLCLCAEETGGIPKSCLSATS
jgi:hypothetical protein